MIPICSWAYLLTHFQPRFQFYKTWKHQKIQITKFPSTVYSLARIKTFKVKSNTKPWFGTDVVNAISTRHKRYTKFKQLDKGIDKRKFKYAKVLLIKNYQ